MLFNKQHRDMGTRKYNRINSVSNDCGLEIVIGRAPAILGWAYAQLGPAVDMPLLLYVADFQIRTM